MEDILAKYFKEREERQLRCPQCQETELIRLPDPERPFSDAFILAREIIRCPTCYVEYNHDFTVIRKQCWV